MRRILAIVCSVSLFVGLSAGCKTKQPVQQVWAKDTVFVERVKTIRDTVLYAQSASVSAVVENPCPDNQPVFKPVLKANNQAVIKAKSSGNNINIECDCDTVAIKAKITDIYEKRYHGLVKEITIQNKERYVPGFIKFLAWSGVLFWLIILIALFFKIIKNPFTI